MFYGFWPSYIEGVYNGEILSRQCISKPDNAGHNDTSVDASFMGNVNTIGLLNDIFGMHNEGNIKHKVGSNMWDIGDPMFRVGDQLADELMCNNAMNEGENYEDGDY